MYLLSTQQFKKLLSIETLFWSIFQWDRTWASRNET
jgi:hypothetical protein